MPSPATLKRIRTKTLEIAYEDSGPEAALQCCSCTGSRMIRALRWRGPAAGRRRVPDHRPASRGYGPTRFLSADTPRSGQQAAMGRDLLDLMDALRLPTASLVGFDWGGRGACVASALWPELVRCLVTSNGYNIQNIAASVAPRLPQQEHRAWYQYYFHTERGRAGLTKYRHELGKLCGSCGRRTGSSTTRRTNVPQNRSTIRTSSISSSIPTAIVTYAPGDPDLEPVEQRLAATPRFRCRPLRCTAAATVSRGRPIPRRKRDSSPAPLRIGSFP